MTVVHQPARAVVIGAGRAGAAVAAALSRAGQHVQAVDPQVGEAGSRLIRLDAAHVPVVPTLDAATAAVRDADLVVEALPERRALKRDVLAEVTRLAPASAALASASLTLTADELGATRGGVSTLRWFGRLDGAVEFRPGAHAARLTQILADASILTTPDTDGVAVEVLASLLNRAAGLREDAAATATDVDLAMRAGCGWRRGPFEILGQMGEDTIADVLQILHGRTGRRSHALRAAVRNAARIPHQPKPVPPPAAPPPPDRLDRVAVIGTGAMAVGIATAFAAAGAAVVIVGRDPERTRAARAAACARAGVGAADWLVTATTAIQDVAGCELVVEAVQEDAAVKHAIFAGLDRVCATDTVLATTTSSLSVAGCAAATTRPQNVIGLHFFNPATAMPLVELVAPDGIDEWAVEVGERAAAQTGKHVVRSPDRPGFLVNSLLFPLVNDAAAAVAAGRVTRGALDATLRRVWGLPVGPMRLLDLVGRHVAHAVVSNLHRRDDDPELVPHPALCPPAAS